MVLFQNAYYMQQGGRTSAYPVGNVQPKNHELTSMSTVEQRQQQQQLYYWNDHEMMQDMQRNIDGLKNQVALAETRLGVYEKKLTIEQQRLKTMAQDSKSTLEGLLDDGELVEREAGREVAILKYKLSQYEVEQHGLQRDLMHENIKYNAAADTCDQQKLLIEQLQNYIHAAGRMEGYCANQYKMLRHQVEVYMAREDGMMKYIEGLSAALGRMTKEMEAQKGKENMQLGTFEREKSSLEKKIQELETEKANILTSQDMREEAKREYIDTLKYALEDGAGLTKTKVKKVVQNMEMLREELYEACLLGKVCKKENNALKKEVKNISKLKEEAEVKVQTLEQELKVKERKLSALEDALRQQKQMTPSASREVGSALATIKNLVTDLDASPLPQGGALQIDLSTDKKQPKVPRTKSSNIAENEFDNFLRTIQEESEQGEVEEATCGQLYSTPSNQTRATSSETLSPAFSPEEQGTAPHHPGKENTMSLDSHPDEALLSNHTAQALKRTLDVKKKIAVNNPLGTKRKLLSVSSNAPGRGGMLPAAQLLNSAFKIPKKGPRDIK